MIGRIAALLMGYVARVVFTHTLSVDYVGVNGLFTDILNVLSLTELGVGTAITYALYRPIADYDIEKQKSLINLYKTIYRIVAAAVLVLGLALLPFMGILIKNPPEVEHLTIIYLMYLANSVISYLLIYRKTLLDAAQLSYIGVLCQTGSWIVQILIQIVVLITTHNFILYLSIMLAGTLMSNLLISYFASKRFPFLKEKNIVPLEKEEKKVIRPVRERMTVDLYRYSGTEENNSFEELAEQTVATLKNEFGWDDYKVFKYFETILTEEEYNEYLKRISREDLLEE